MHRRPLLDLLDRYVARHSDEADVVAALASFVRAHPDCFERSCVPGHVTGSAWLLSSDHERVLLTHHRKLGRWLQLGGHADGDADSLRVALREAREESGLSRIEPLALDGDPIPLDVDIHEIPARGDEPAHLHHDIRYLLVAAPAQEIAISDESVDLRWFDRRRLQDVLDDESQLRMERKTRDLLARLAAARPRAT
jgi:8-oxo-dGTP pyrophosphatase MutT (NUDIX family)